jgi:hypothetical protein
MLGGFLGQQPDESALVLINFAGLLALKRYCKTDGLSFD